MGRETVRADAAVRRRRRPIRWRLLAAGLSLAMLPTLGAVGSGAPAWALPQDYPTWDDVQAAMRDEAAAAQKKQQLEAAITGLQAEVDRTQADLEAKGLAYQEAQERYDEQRIVTDTLQSQADQAQAEADEAKRNAAQFISALGRTGGQDTTSVLLTQGDPDGLLDRITAMDTLGKRNDQIYQRAVQLQNTASSKADEAKKAQELLEQLRQAAEAAFQAAQEAAAAAQERLEAQQTQIAQMQAMLAVLAEKRQATIEDYNAGLRAQWGTGAEGEVSAQGWARPAAGYISSNFGNRYHPIYHVWKLHSGVDLAGQGCGATIRAAHAGTVTYAGPNGDLGNYVQIDHGDGTSSGYGHIMNGGIGVHIGQIVGPGQPIARVGSTGGSTGCHLHFMIRINGGLTDPVPFMRARGISLG